MRAFAIGMGLGLSLHAPSAGAAPVPGSVWVEVAREAGSEGCPDAARVVEAALVLFPDQPLPVAANAADADLRVTISVRPEGRGHLASMVPHDTASVERTLADPDPACGGLAEALAVALVVWRGAHEDARAGASQVESPSAGAPAPLATEEPPVTEEPQVKPVRPAEPLPANDPARRPARATSRALVLGVEASALGSAGMFAEPGFGGSAGASLATGFGAVARARLLRAVAWPAEVSPGSVSVDLWAGLFAGCFRFEVARRWSLAPCVELGWGSQHAEARELLASNEEAERPWVVLGPNLTATFLVAEPFSLLGTGTLFGRLHDQVYLVDGEAVARQPSIGGYLGVGLVAEWALWSEKTGTGDRGARELALTNEPDGQ